MVKMGLKQLDHTEKWSHPPKKKWIHNYLADDEGGDDGGGEGVKRVLVRRPPAHYPAHQPGPTSPMAPRTAPTSPAHVREEVTPRRVAAPPLTPPMVGAARSQQASPRDPPSLPGSPASSPPRVVARGGSFPLGLLSAFRQDSVSPPSSVSSGGEPRPPHAPFQHIHNGLCKSLALPPAAHQSLYPQEDHALREDKKRAGTTPSREVHNKLEKNRRAHLKECFETLRRQLPTLEDKKISNQTILKAAHRHIQTLKRKEREYEHEMERLAREKIAHQQKLSSLKKELSARWDHIDFSTLLPDPASLDHHRDKDTKSTTTASEQPDFDDDSATAPPQPPRDAGTQASAPVPVPIPVSLPAPPPPNVSPRLHPDPTSRQPATSFGSEGGSAPPRDHFSDPNQPLNLSTSMDVVRASPRSQAGRSPHQVGDWAGQQTSSHYTPILATYTSGAGGEEELWGAREIATRTPPTSISADQLPIMSGGGSLHLPAQLVAGGVQLNGAPGGLLGQPAIQVITPEGYKFLPADHTHTHNVPKPLTITLAHPAAAMGAGGEGERGDTHDEAGKVMAVAAASGGGATPMVVALNKSVVPALHLTVPRTFTTVTPTPGSNGMVTTVPLNLSVGGAGVKVTQAVPSLLSSYLPITHTNGLTQLVSGLGGNMGTLVSGLGGPLVTPLVVSQGGHQRGGMPSAAMPVTKGLKVGGGGPVPLVSTQYTTSLGGSLGGLVKPVVVVSAPTVAGIVTTAPAIHTIASAKP